MGTLWSLCSRSTCLLEWTVCDWCWAGSLSLWIILFCRGTDLKGTKAYGITGCNSAVKVTDSFLEKDRGTPGFTFFLWGDVSGNLCEKVPLELRPEGRGRACWRGGSGRGFWGKEALAGSRNWNKVSVVGVWGVWEARRPRVEARLGRALWMC